MAHGDPTRGHVLLAGGGTGGHVFPALALAEELGRRGWALSFAGTESGLESRLVPARGLAFHHLPARPVVGRGPLDQAAAAWTLLSSAVAARRLVRRLETRVVVGTGGYASAPAVLGARLAGRPALLVEPNARPGAANRWLSRFAQRAVVAYSDAARGLRCPAVETGVPVRAEFFALPPPPPAAPPRLLVLGGSQGARQLNLALPAALAAVRATRGGELPLRVLHQTGPRHLEETRAAYAAAGLEEVQLAPFLDDVAAAMAGSHLVVSRAGAMTLAEICAAGRPALLLPLAIAGGHQVDNARILESAGAARVLAAAEFTPAPLAVVLDELVAAPARLAEMGRAARALARPGAAAAIADQVEELAQSRGAR